jgi:glutathionylspermidine synthase
MWDHIAASWRNRDPHLYGRFDLAYDGAGPAKMLEYNADTPTSLYESASFQWVWLEHMIELGAINATADQFNSIHETLVERLQTIFPEPSDIHFSADAENEEDRKTVAYLEDVARVAGHRPHFVDINAIGVDAQGRFADADSFVIEKMFKLYPLEYMFREDYGQYLGQGSKMTMLEPLWKGILSNKGMLALLWEKFAGHPNLLPTYFENEGGPSNQNPVVRKPLFSREGENVEITNPDGSQEIVVGEYGAEGHVLQAYTPIPKFGDDYMVIGSWVVGDKACGIGIREDATQITKNSSRFIPHFID